MFDFYEVMQIAEVKAIHSALDPTMASIWRRKCRDYSLTFHTPLHMVYQLDPEFVLQNLYEMEYTVNGVSEDLESILEYLYKAKDPTYQPINPAETEELVDAALNNLIKKGLGKKPKQVEKKEVSLPKSGGLSFTDLAKAEESAEQGKSGF